MIVCKFCIGTESAQESILVQKFNECNDAEQITEILSNMCSQQLLGGQVLPRHWGKTI